MEINENWDVAMLKIDRISDLRNELTATIEDRHNKMLTITDGIINNNGATIEIIKTLDKRICDIEEKYNRRFKFTCACLIVFIALDIINIALKLMS